mmetsp:Transcript_5692/g.13311  ORF Transcript_5692/g.13311 Transcript_5692/m.13311 type:complete len:242 (-) Transcript_5692:467-1192(-)
MPSIKGSPYLHIFQAMSRQSREKMVLNLELESTMEPMGHPVGVNVQGGGKLMAEKIQILSTVDLLTEERALEGVHREMRTADLHVKNSSNHVRNQDKADSLSPSRELHSQNSEPCEIREHGHDFGPPSLHIVTCEKHIQGLEVQVEASNGHDGIKEVVLHADQKFGSGIEVHHALVVIRVKRLEQPVVDAEDREMLNIGVVINGVGDNVMSVVVALPPSDGNSGRKWTHKEANSLVNITIV